MKMYQCLAILFMCVAGSAFAERHVHVNGKHLEAEEIRMMDHQFGYQVPRANYWSDMRKGEWGYEGSDRVQGVLASIKQYGAEVMHEQQRQVAVSSTYINSSQNGSVVSGNINGRNCTTFPQAA